MTVVRVQLETPHLSTQKLHTQAEEEKWLHPGAVEAILSRMSGQRQEQLCFSLPAWERDWGRCRLL